MITTCSNRKKRRAFVKGRIIECEKKKLFESMMLGSKTDIMLSNYCYDGKMKTYLADLPFLESRIIFMFRCRMFPTRVNFPERWTSDLNCVYCGNLDTDEHLFTCWGFLDICQDVNIDHKMFYKLDVSMDELRSASKVLMKIYDRLLNVQNDKDLK